MTAKSDICSVVHSLAPRVLVPLQARSSLPRRSECRRCSATPAAWRRSRGSSGMKSHARWRGTPRVHRTNRPTACAEEELGGGRRGVDAHAQARDVDALGDHAHRDEPGVGAGGEVGDAGGGERVVGGDDARA